MVAAEREFFDSRTRGIVMPSVLYFTLYAADDSASENLVLDRIQDLIASGAVVVHEGRADTLDPEHADTCRTCLPLLKPQPTPA